MLVDGRDFLSRKKQKVVRLLCQGYTPPEVAKETGVGQATIYRWLKLPLMRRMIEITTENLIHDAVRDQESRCV